MQLESHFRLGWKGRTQLGLQANSTPLRAQLGTPNVRSFYPGFRSVAANKPFCIIVAKYRDTTGAPPGHGCTWILRAKMIQIPRQAIWALLPPKPSTC